MILPPDITIAQLYMVSLHCIGAPMAMIISQLTEAAAILAIALSDASSRVCEWKISTQVYQVTHISGKTATLTAFVSSSSAKDMIEDAFASQSATSTCGTAAATRKNPLYVIVLIAISQKSVVQK